MIIYAHEVLYDGCKKNTRWHLDLYLKLLWQLQTLATALTKQIDSFFENNRYNVVKVNR